MESCPMNRTLDRSLEFPFTRIRMKLFRTRSKEMVTECQCYFDLPSMVDLI